MDGGLVENESQMSSDQIKTLVGCVISKIMSLPSYIWMIISQYKDPYLITSIIGIRESLWQQVG